MIILIKLILAHFIGDFLLQPKSWVYEKEKLKIRSLKLYIHVFLHGILVLLILWDLQFWLLALLIAILHGIIDLMKLYCQKEENKSNWFFIDQALHFISILVLWGLFLKPELDFSYICTHSDLWVYLTAIILITGVSAVVVREVMSEWTKKLKDNKDVSLNNAGKYIGILERLFVFFFVIIGSWESIGFILAAKSIFRFGDLKDSKDRKLTEYVLIGTLLSFGIAIAVGIIVIKIIEIV